MRSLVSLLVVGCIALALTSCGGYAGSGGGGGEADLTAVATTSQVADLVSNVGGARVDVEGILPSGGDPHAFEPGTAGYVMPPSLIDVSPTWFAVRNQPWPR